MKRRVGLIALLLILWVSSQSMAQSTSLGQGTGVEKEREGTEVGSKRPNLSRRFSLKDELKRKPSRFAGKKLNTDRLFEGGGARFENRDSHGNLLLSFSGHRFELVIRSVSGEEAPVAHWDIPPGG